jgi:hypothetical protein
VEYKYTLTFPSLRDQSDQQEAKLHLLVESNVVSNKVLYDGPLDYFDPQKVEESGGGE